MSDRPLYVLRAANGSECIGVVSSTDEGLLRTFGAAYMRDRSTTGEVALYGPNGQEISGFDVWQDRWKDADPAQS
jgi:hypothetical protein